MFNEPFDHLLARLQRGGELDRNGGSVSQTARQLGISRTTVYRHLREQPAGAAQRG